MEFIDIFHIAFSIALCIFFTFAFRSIIKEYKKDKEQKERIKKHQAYLLQEELSRIKIGDIYIETTSKPLWEKDVHIMVEEAGDNYVITIKNNGEKFSGDISKVFEYGYCHGKMKKNGIGMHSARKSMKELGGSIEFISTPNEAFHVRHKLTIPKYGK